jgi:hypothetical protein
MFPLAGKKVIVFMFQVHVMFPMAGDCLVFQVPASCGLRFSLFLVPSDVSYGWRLSFCTMCLLVFPFAEDFSVFQEPIVFLVAGEEGIFSEFPVLSAVS